MMARARGAVPWRSKFEAGVVPATIATPANRTNAMMAVDRSQVDRPAGAAGWLVG